MVNNERLSKLTNILVEHGMDGCLLGATEDIVMVDGEGSVILNKANKDMVVV